MSINVKVDVALIHAPVVNRNGETIGSAVTNLDLHDISRAGRTYGIQSFWVVTPYEEQQELVAQIVEHWTSGHGSKADTDRASALSLIRVRSELNLVVDELTEKYEQKPLVLATCAKQVDHTIGYVEAREEIEKGTSVLLLFGTAWGLAPEVLDTAAKALPPIRGTGSFNHLSVRSAVSIILDRLLADRN